MKSICVCSLVVLCVVDAAPPEWWLSGDFPIIETDSIVPEAGSNSWGSANIGQGKHVAWSALQTIRLIDPEVAEEVEFNLVGNGKPLLSWSPGYTSYSDYSPLQVGHLKSISAPFYKTLNAVVPEWLSGERAMNETESGGIYPWTDSIADDMNKGMANIGQLKSVFALHLTDSLDGDPGSDYLEFRFLGTSQFYFDPAADSDGDGVSNIDELRGASRYLRDVDGDGLSDGMELEESGLDPFQSDSNNDGIPDGQTDLDGDLMSDQWEEELVLRSSDQNIEDYTDIDPVEDFDGDGLTNLQEYQLGFSGHQADSDGDGYSDRLSVDQKLRLRLDESSGLSAMDDSGGNHHGILASSPTWQAMGGVDNGALQFAGTSEAVEIPAGILDGASSVTLSLWFKTSSASSSQTLLSGAATAQSPELSIGIENGDTIRFTTGGGNSVIWDAGRNLSDGLWHHVILVRDSLAGEASLHLDGAPFGLPQTVSLGVLAVDVLALGQRHQTVSTYDSSKAFSGLLDEVRIWSTAISSTHLSELFQPNDLDLDGLPDDWELSLFANLSTLAAAGDDLDGDGLSNRQEFEDGTDPKDYYNGSSPVVSLISGSGQTVYNGQRTGDPLVFKVTSDGTTVLVDAPVELSHLEPYIGGVETIDGDIFATSLVLRSDSNGEVAVYFKAN